MAQSEIRYTVKRVRRERKMCSVCGGTGKRDRKTSHGLKSEPCPHCESGVAWIEYQTEIDLVDALTELGIRFVLPASMKPKTDQG